MSLHHHHDDKRIKPAITRDKSKDKHKVIDFRKALDPDNDIYICEHCDCRLIPYFDIKGERLTAPGGKLFQCGKCGQIKDTSGVGKYDIKRPEQLTSRGDNADNLFITHWRQPPTAKPKQFDIDPGDDQMYKGMGFHIVRTHIVSGDGRTLRNDYNENS